LTVAGAALAAVVAAADASADAAAVAAADGAVVAPLPPQAIATMAMPAKAIESFLVRIIWWLLLLSATLRAARRSM
jgi:hypothetical protein